MQNTDMTANSTDMTTNNTDRAFHYALVRYKLEDGRYSSRSYIYNKPRTLKAIKALIAPSYMKENWTEIWGSNTNKTMVFPEDGTCTLLEAR